MVGWVIIAVFGAVTGFGIATVIWLIWTVVFWGRLVVRSDWSRK